MDRLALGVKDLQAEVTSRVFALFLGAGVGEGEQPPGITDFAAERLGLLPVVQIEGAHGEIRHRGSGAFIHHPAYEFTHLVFSSIIAL